MSPFNLETCARPNILALQPYRCARDDFKDDGTNILLDANENAYGPSLPTALTTTTSTRPAQDGPLSAAALGLDFAGLNRYPDPEQVPLKRLLCHLRSTGAHTTQPLRPENLFVGVGSDEAIDALIRSFCVPGKDRILTCPPTYGMYAVSAQVNDVSLVKVPLTPGPEFGLDVDAITSTLTNEKEIKLVYLCSPGNPTGSLLSKASVEAILAHPTWNGVVILDEAYIDFAGEEASLAELVNEYPNLVVMQTFSKGFGMAGIRLGAAFAPAPIAQLLNNLKAPYNISSPTSALACFAAGQEGLAVMRGNRTRVEAQRARMVREMPLIPGVGRLRGGLDSNFMLYEMLNARDEPDNAVALAVYEKLAGVQAVVVRFRGKEHGCLGCLRITVGTEEEVTRLLGALRRVLTEVRGEEAEVPGSKEEQKEKQASAILA